MRLSPVGIAGSNRAVDIEWQSVVATDKASSEVTVHSWGTVVRQTMTSVSGPIAGVAWARTDSRGIARAGRNKTMPFSATNKIRSSSFCLYWSMFLEVEM
jgi:hypothetical protein